MLDKNRSLKPAAKKEVVPQKPYAKKSWKADVYVYVCEICDLNLNDEGDMILHVAGHVPEEQRDAALEALIQE